jgi:hypothetical protein
MAPTAGTAVVTATPSAPVRGQRAAMENVLNGAGAPPLALDQQPGGLTGVRAGSVERPRAKSLDRKMFCNLRLRIGCPGLTLGNDLAASQDGIAVGEGKGETDILFYQQDRGAARLFLRP